MQKLLRIKAACPCHMNCYLCLLLQSFPQREKQSTKGKSSVNGRPIALAARTKTSTMGMKSSFGKRLHISLMQNSLTILYNRIASVLDSTHSFYALTTIIWPVTWTRINYMCAAGALSFICGTALSGTHCMCTLCHLLSIKRKTLHHVVSTDGRIPSVGMNSRAGMN